MTAREIVELDSKLTANLATNTQALATHYESALARLDANIHATKNAQAILLRQVEARLMSQMDTHHAGLVAEIVRNAEEEREDSRKDLTVNRATSGSDHRLFRDAETCFARADCRKLASALGPAWTKR